MLKITLNGKTLADPEECVKIEIMDKINRRPILTSAGNSIASAMTTLQSLKPQPITID